MLPSYRQFLNQIVIPALIGLLLVTVAILVGWVASWL